MSLSKGKDAAISSRLGKGGRILDKTSYSHAALLVDAERLIESSDDGVIHQILTPRLAVVNGESKACALLPGAYVRAQLLRSSPPISYQSFLISYEHLANTIWGKEYPPFERLARASRWVWLGRVFLRMKDRWERIKSKSARRWRPDNYGDFCSQLIARFYDRAGIRLFDDHVPTDAISPTLLAESCLVPVCGALVWLTDDCLMAPAQESLTADPDDLKMRLVRRVQAIAYALDGAKSEVQGLGSSANLPQTQEAILKKVMKATQFIYSVPPELSKATRLIVTAEKNLARLLGK